MGETRKTAGWRHIKKEECPHRAQLREGVASAKAECEECGGTEDLRLCLTCGYVACCESHAAHNTAHFRSSGHPLIRPHRTGYDWLWCYECKAFLD